MSAKARTALDEPVTRASGNKSACRLLADARARHHTPRKTGGRPPSTTMSNHHLPGRPGAQVVTGQDGSATRQQLRRQVGDFHCTALSTRHPKGTSRLATISVIVVASSLRDAVMQRWREQSPLPLLPSHGPVPPILVILTSLTVTKLVGVRIHCDMHPSKCLGSGTECGWGWRSGLLTVVVAAGLERPQRMRSSRALRHTAESTVR